MEALFSHHRLIKKISKIRVREKRRKKGGAMFSEGPMVEFKREFSKRALKTVVAFYLSLEKKLADGSYVSIYPDLLQAYADGRAPKPNLLILRNSLKK